MNGKSVLKLSIFVVLAVGAVFSGMKISTRDYTFKGSVIEPVGLGAEVFAQDVSHIR